jgi:P-type conjugative transfer protein TrbG
MSSPPIAARLALNDYARANDPFTKVGKQQVAVEVSSVIRASPDSFRVAWTERHYENGQLRRDRALDRDPHHRRSRPPRDAERLRANPLGIYVNAINWSKELSPMTGPRPVRSPTSRSSRAKARPAPGPVAAGDTVRWIIGDTESGSGATRRVHILVKPTRPDITTNLVINTDRRTYMLELRATASTYMASVSWTYPQDQLIALRGGNAAAAAAAPIARGVDVSALNFRYRIEGDRAAWRLFARSTMADRCSSSFRRDLAGRDAAAVRDRATPSWSTTACQGRYMVVDRLFAAAELRLGDRRSEQGVRIVRDDGRRARP